MIKKLIASIATLLLSQVAFAQVLSCEQISMARAGVGYAYKGVVVNDDYALSVTIPKGLTGWSGVDKNAPFHGFTIFLDPTKHSCIYFEIHIRVDEDSKPEIPPTAQATTLGGGQAWQWRNVGEVKKQTMSNIHTVFSISHAGRTDDGEVVLIAPNANLAEARRAYDAFIRSLKFFK